MNDYLLIQSSQYRAINEKCLSPQKLSITRIGLIISL